MTYMLDTNVLMHFVNDERRYAKILKQIDRIGKVRICISSITVHEVHTKLIKAKVSKDKVEALAAVLAQFTVHNFTSFLSIIGKLFTASFFEAVLTKIIIWCGEKLAPMTTNTLDNELVEEIKKRLEA
jgi:predicted nucleic acid-binding protein